MLLFFRSSAERSAMQPVEADPWVKLHRSPPAEFASSAFVTVVV